MVAVMTANDSVVQMKEQLESAEEKMHHYRKKTEDLIKEVRFFRSDLFYSSMS